MLFLTTYPVVGLQLYCKAKEKKVWNKVNSDGYFSSHLSEAFFPYSVSARFAALGHVFPQLCSSMHLICAKRG